MSGRFKKGFTLVEIMVVLAIFAIIIAIAGATWLRSREISRSQGCQENLQKIDQAKEVYALENKLPDGTNVAMESLYASDGSGYIKRRPECPASGVYTANPIGENPTCDYTVTMSGVKPHQL